MCTKYLLILDVLTTLAVILQAHVDIRDQKPGKFTDLFSLPNEDTYALRYPEIASTIHRTQCEFPCGKISSKEREKQYLVYYDPSQVILPSNVNLYLSMFANNNYKSQGSKKTQTSRLKSVESPLQHNVASNMRYPFTGKENLKNHKVDNAETENKALTNYPKIPETYLKPPKVTNEEYPFYDNKPAKLIDEQRPHRHRNANKIHNHRLTYEEDKNEKEFKPAYVRDHAPEEKEQDDTAIETVNVSKKQSPSKERKNPLELSPDGDRVEFQIQGHDGPKSYIFGFDTGDGKNRQYRLEEKLKNGTVKGHYGYYDAKGKLRTIRYIARPLEGYEERHHESNAHKPED